VLLEHAEAIRWAANVHRAAMQRDFEAADPVPGFALLDDLAIALAKAATQASEAQRATLAAGAHTETLELLALLIAGAEGPSLHTDAAEMSERRRRAAQFRAVRHLLGAASGSPEESSRDG
jgi:hypothetical protein